MIFRTAYEPCKHIAPFHQSKARGRLFTGGNRSMKTTAGAAETEQFLLDNDGVFMWGLGPNRNLMKAMKDAFYARLYEDEELNDGKGSLLMPYESRTNRQPMVNGSCIEWVTADDPEALQGAGLDAWWFDEMAKTSKRSYENLTMRMKGGAIQKWWITTTPINGPPWLYSTFIDPMTKVPYAEVFYARTEDNPYIDQATVEAEKIGKSQDYIDERFHGIITLKSGRVYALDPKKHIYHTSIIPSKDAKFIAGVDWGFTHLFMCVWFFIEPSGHVYIYMEHPMTSGGTSDWIPRLRSNPYCDRTLFICDPEDPSKIRDFNNAGLTAVPGIRTFETGHGMLRDLINSNRLHVSSTCIEVLRGFAEYEWQSYNEDNADRPQRPKKKSDDAMKALQYGCSLGLIPQPVEETDDWGAVGDRRPSLKRILNEYNDEQARDESTVPYPAFRRPRV